MQVKGDAPEGSSRNGEGEGYGTITIVIPGKPRGKQPAVQINGRYYTPPEVRSYANEIALAAYMERRRTKTKKLKGAILSVNILACFALPAKAKDRRIEDPHLQDPDVDNIAKAILDGLQPGMIDNDNRVHELHVRKMWARQDEVIVTINWKG